MKPDDVNRAAGLAGEWVWLFPATYLAHIAEEYWGGEGFPRWISRVAGATLTTPEFLTLNAVAWVLMAGAMVGVVRGLWRWPLVAFGLVVLLNALLHAGGSVVTRSYSPGLVTGLLFWLPLGAFTLWRAWADVPRRTFWTGVAVGLAMHAVVSLLALGRV
jgi:hypothetical protein